MPDKKYATVINCMDGRAQEPAIGFMKQKYGVDYVDSVTEAGPIKYLAEGVEFGVIESIRRRVQISVSAHGSRRIAVVGHFDCAGNPVDKSTQLEQIKASKRRILDWRLGEVEVIGLWIDENREAEQV